MKATTKEQRKAMKQVYDKWFGSGSYLAFRRGVSWACMQSCLMVQVPGMWLGIEPDGYTHS